ncbi:MAG: hypothetical protein QOJ06_3300 [Pseudonocardiales bacterium]|jgi:hypothetical protein|nr:hypothetical protein [Pseudonocardiales bacterium]
MINSADHASAAARGVQPPRHLHWAESGRTKPVRRSVDLSPTYHIKLTQWCAETADVIGTARVTGQDVIRALVARLLMDDSLARKIRADLSIDI